MIQLEALARLEGSGDLKVIEIKRPEPPDITEMRIDPIDNVDPRPDTRPYRQHHRANKNKRGRPKRK